jgi:hypothetical protein
VLEARMKRARETSRVKKPPPSSTVALPVLPWEVVGLIFGQIPWDAVATLWSVLLASKSCFPLLLPTLRFTATYVMYLSDDGFYLPMGKMGNTPYVPETPFTVILKQYLRRNRGIRERLHESYEWFVLSHASASLLLAQMNFICLDTQHVYRENKGVETSFRSVGPTELVRLRHVFHEERTGELAVPLHTMKIRVVRNMPEKKAEQIKAMIDAVQEEKDASVKQLMAFYLTEKKAGSPLDRRAKCFLLTRKGRKLRSPQSDDCFGDVVVDLHGTGDYVHIYSEEASEFRTRCFNYTGSQDDLKLAYLLWKNRLTNWQRLHSSLAKPTKW